MVDLPGQLAVELGRDIVQVEVVLGKELPVMLLPLGNRVVCLTGFDLDAFGRRQQSSVKFVRRGRGSRVKDTTFSTQSLPSGRRGTLDCLLLRILSLAGWFVLLQHRPVVSVSLADALG